MMMPANFSAVSENEMTYVVGGSIADYLAPAMGATEWSNVSKNMITLIGNKYLGTFVDNTVGAFFSGAWTPGAGVNGLLAGLSTNWGTDDNGDAVDKTTWYQKGINVLGYAAALYNLGFGSVKNSVGDASIGMSKPAGQKITYVKMV